MPFFVKAYFGVALIVCLALDNFAPSLTGEDIGFVAAIVGFIAALIAYFLGPES